ncbi:beta-1,3-glucan-binding protein [Calliopsis andreniformis]|uniref:beta-1,3-glucan-binding protein n=1 Tax=Calliopsis andreniformis TaxID=337506 RepID=UPI003FCEAFF4
MLITRAAETLKHSDEWNKEILITISLSRWDAPRAEAWRRGVLKSLESHQNYLLRSVDAYTLPQPTFEFLSPRGIRISIPHEEGVQFFAFQGNVNKKIGPSQVGEISGEVYRQKDGKWTFQRENINMREGDIIHYWIYAQVDRSTYKRENQTWTVTSKSEETNVSSRETRKSTVGALLFNETFNYFNKSVWKRDVKIPLGPDYEFCVYHNEHHESLVQVQNGVLRIKPLILEDYYGESATSYGKLQLGGCTSNIPAECTRKAAAFSILPPVMSARLMTKDHFYFRYGKIEIRAKFPEGDWLYPEIWLEPKYNNYGPGYASGCIILGLARGNNNLINVNNRTIFDSRRLDFGVRIDRSTGLENYMVSKIRENGPKWTKDFHVYTTIWTSDGFQFFVDGDEVDRLTPDTDGWLNDDKFDKMAPFDQEFYITIGVGVGGIRVFPDETTNSGSPKPWRNVGAKAMLQFWNQRNQWLPIWRQENGAHTALEVDYIRVWSF